MSTPGADSVAAWLVSGAGNDFLVLVEPDADPPAQTVRAWCRRGLSVGADGLFVLRRAGGGRVTMVHYNADGGRAEQCINGTRCAARLAFELGWARGEVTLETDAGEVAARDAGGAGIALELAAPGPPERRELAVDGQASLRWYVVSGGPHLVVPVDGSLAEAPVASLGPALRSHPALGPAGANVDFVRWRSPHRFEIRTFERGVEGETLACGTGVLAAAAVGRHLGVLELPARAATAGGFDLEVGEAAAGRWTLTGDARLLARLELLPAALHLPAAARWD